MISVWLFTKCCIWQQCCNCQQRHPKTLQSKAELTQIDILVQGTNIKLTTCFHKSCILRTFQFYLLTCLVFLWEFVFVCDQNSIKMPYNGLFYKKKSFGGLLENKEILWKKLVKTCGELITGRYICIILFFMDLSFRK